MRNILRSIALLMASGIYLNWLFDWFNIDGLTEIDVQQFRLWFTLIFLGYVYWFRDNTKVLLWACGLLISPFIIVWLLNNTVSDFMIFFNLIEDQTRLDLKIDMFHKITQPPYEKWCRRHDHLVQCDGWSFKFSWYLIVEAIAIIISTIKFKSKTKSYEY